MLSLPLAFIACDSNEYEIPSEEISDLYILTSAGVATTEMRAEVNKFFSLSDLSQGTLERQWTIPNDAFFLKGPLENNLNNYDEYIINPGETTSSEQTIHTTFKKGDSLTEMKYYGVFKDSTEFEFDLYYDRDLQAFVPDTIRTVKIDNKWVAEYTFLIDVYDTVVATPELRNLDGNTIDYLNTQSLTVQYGDQIIIEDISALLDDNNARPNETKWRMHTTELDAEEETSYSVSSFNREGDFSKRIIDTLTFTRLGEYQLELTSTRARDEDLGASSDTYDVPMIFNVVSLAEDLVIIDSEPVVETDDDRILIKISSPMEALTDSAVADFNVTVDGDVRSVSTVLLGQGKDANDQQIGIITLTLDAPLEPIDATKSVTVSYAGTSIMSKDERLLQQFSDVAIDVYVPVPVDQVGEITGSEEGKILVRFNQDLDPDSISNSTDPTAGFMVELNGNTATVSAVSLNADNAKILEIEIVEGLFSNDVISIGYTGPGDIKSIGEGAINDFEAKAVIPYENNFLGDLAGSFEDTLGDVWAPASNNSGTISYSTEQFVSGSSSVKLVTTGTDRARLESKVDFQLTNGSVYKISYKRYVTSGTAATGEKVFIQYPQKNISGGLGNYSTTRDVWETVEVIYTATEDATTQDFYIQLNPGDAVVYYDDFLITPYTER